MNRNSVSWASANERLLYERLLQEAPNGWDDLMSWGWRWTTEIQWMKRGPWQQSSWGQHGALLGPTGPRWAPCWPHETCYLGTLILYSLGVKMSYRKISQSLEAAWLAVRIIVSFWNLTPATGELLPWGLSNFRTIGQRQISRDFALRRLATL